MVTKIVEQGRLITEALPAGGDADIRMVQVITPGWGSSGYYSAEVLQAACEAGLFAAGTHMHLDHQTRAGARDLPERSVKDIAAVLDEAGSWDPVGQRVIAPVKVMGPYVEQIDALAPYIGVSISGSATDVKIGTFEGRTGPVIEGLAQIDSVDFVTRAGRGGKVLVAESAEQLTTEAQAVNALAVTHGVDEATVNDIRKALTTLLQDAYASDQTWVWVRDFDQTTVWFDVESQNVNGLFGQAYALADDGAVSLEGEAFEVRIVTTYEPVTAPPGASESSSTEPAAPAAESVPATRPDGNTTQKEGAMPEIKIDEAEHGRLVEAAGRVTALEAENSELKAKNAELAESAAATARISRAKEIVAEAKVFDDLQTKGLLADLPIKDGVLDEAAFTETVKTAAEKLAESRGRGTGIVTGFGGTPVQNGGADVSEADLDALDSIAFGTIQEA